MSTIIKKALKYLVLFLGIDLIYFSLLKIIFDFSGNTDIFLMTEGFVFCALLYAYLGVKYFRDVKEESFTVTKYILTGLGFFITGLLVIFVPVHIISGFCDLFGVILFGISNESNVQIVLLWIICSVVTALICYDVAEKKHREANKHDKTDDNDL